MACGAFGGRAGAAYRPSAGMPYKLWPAGRAARGRCARRAKAIAHRALCKLARNISRCAACLLGVSNEINVPRRFYIAGGAGDLVGRHVHRPKRPRRGERNSNSCRSYVNDTDTDDRP